jgi:hypothetical protein
MKGRHSSERHGRRVAEVTSIVPPGRSDLTPTTASSELSDNVRSLLDWLVDEEVKRWLREVK